MVLVSGDLAALEVGISIAREIETTIQSSLPTPLQEAVYG